MIKQKKYGLHDCEKLMSLYCEHGGETHTVEEGTLGLGIVVCEAKGYKTAVIREHPETHWTCYHTIRLYNQTPKKYVALINQRKGDE